MGGHLELSDTPEPIAKIYRQALASFEHVDDPLVKRALVGVLGAVQSDVASAKREADGGDRVSCIG